MINEIVFDPFVPWSILWGIAACLTAVVIFAAWRGLFGWVWRAVVFAGCITALAQPSLQTEDRTPLTDIVVVIVDETASQNLSDRAAQTQAAQATIEAQIGRMSNTELRVVRVLDSPDNRGSLVMTALTQAMANEPNGRLAGAILISDGQVHDAGIAPDLPAPLHLLMTGQPRDWDRRLVVENAPAFAILDEEVTLTIKVEDQGPVPAQVSETSPIFVSIDGGPEERFTIPVGRAVEVPLMLPHGGMNVIQFTVPEADGELTTRNNSALVQINGVRDRLRVLLVSGEPHNGERTWRNLLKSDASVDLVHFTILRPPTKQDGVPVTELSLIAFPTRELFMEKVDEFDLIIFDRYKLRGILPGAYLDNIAQYVESGGAVLFAAGPDFATADSIYRSGLSRVIPAEPTGRVIEEGFTPRLSSAGARHPVTEGLGGVLTADQDPTWGRWFRQIDLVPNSGEVVMDGIDGRPLVVLDRVGEGRVAVLGSDHAWLWTRGVEGGGPQLELLRRLAHWMMKEPELEEESLTASADGATMQITRRSLGEGARTVEVTSPDGTVQNLPMEEVSPGKYVASFEGAQMGLYRLREGEEEAVMALGPSAPREFEETIATRDKLAPVLAATNGGALALSTGAPAIRKVSQGRPAAGRGWIGITPRDAYVTQSVALNPVLPAWLWLALLAGLSIVAWLREGRR